MKEQDTIVAIATPPGLGGVGIIRISGPKATQIASQLTKKSEFKPRLAHFCHFYIADEVADSGLSLFFKAPHSFTGEDVVELQTHGSPIVLDMLVNACIGLGARMAQPGEFSQRAFLNDKIDLTQAEAIADLIAAQSETAARLAVKSLQGDFSNKIKALVDALIHLRMFVEAAIDFPEEEIDFLSDGKVANLLSPLLPQTEKILEQANQGAILREGMSIVLAGRPNAGKSTLINQLAGKELAIVTDIPGTTRDVMREHVLLDDIPVHLIDTAGIRQAQDVVEQEGIKRAWNEIKQADCVLLLIDIAQIDQAPELIAEVKAALPNEIPIIQVVNKIDTQDKAPKSELERVYVAAKTGLGIDLLKEKLKQLIGFHPGEGQFIARRRHLDALERGLEFLRCATRSLENGSGELLAEDLRLAQHSFNEITGEFTSDDLLGEIFSSFCIGK